MEIVPAIQKWCRARGSPQPRVSKGWEYLGQTMVEWGSQCYVDLLPQSRDYSTCKVVARVCICNPFCVNKDRIYLVQRIDNVGAHMDKLFTALEMFFPAAEEAQEAAIDLCVIVAKEVLAECREAASKKRSIEYNLAQSVYRKQYDKGLVTALVTLGFSHVSYSAEGLLRVNWEKPITTQDQALFKLYAQ
jgi:hypothetical protein